MSSQFNTGGFAGTTAAPSSSSPPVMTPPPQPSELTLPPTSPRSDDHGGKEYQPSSPLEVTPSKKPSIFSKDRYTPLFDVEQSVIAWRLLKVVLWCGPAFYQADPRDPTARPDLWAPFWITTTLVLVLGVLGAIQQNEGRLDITKVSYAATTFYCGLIIPPIILYWFLRWFRARRPLSNIISLYGYSFFIYIPMAFVTICRAPWIDVICCATAVGMSTCFLVKNVYCYFLQQQTDLYAHYHAEHAGDATPVNVPEKPSKTTGLILMIGVIAIHCLIGLLSYIFFFYHDESVDPTPPEPTPPTPPDNSTAVNNLTQGNFLQNVAVLLQDEPIIAARKNNLIKILGW